MPTTTRFNMAFSDWMRGDLDRADRLWDPPEFDNKGIKLGLRRFAPHAIAYLTRHSCSVAVEWDYEVWDFLYSDDLAPERSPDGGWRCGQCPHPAAEFATIEQLWAHHSFEPLAAWVEETLMPAEYIYLCKLRGCSWAGLGDSPDQRKGALRYMIFAADTSED